MKYVKSLRNRVLFFKQPGTVNVPSWTLQDLGSKQPIALIAISSLSCKFRLQIHFWKQQVLTGMGDAMPIIFLQ